MVKSSGGCCVECDRWGIREDGEEFGRMVKSLGECGWSQGGRWMVG